MSYLPNFFTLSRFLAALLTAWAYLEQNWLWATAFLAWAAISDVLDGWLARQLHATSALGETLDLLADKFLVLLLLSTLLWLNPSWWLGVLLGVTVLREVAMANLRKQQMLPVRFWGKLKTFLQFSGLFFLTWPMTFVAGLWVFTFATAVGLWSLWKYWQKAQQNFST